MRAMLLSLALGAMIANGALAQSCCGQPECCDQAACCDQTHDCCNSCGAKKRCKIVCEMETVEVTYWCVECEDFCVANPRLCGVGSTTCQSCGSACGGDCGLDCGAGCNAGCDSCCTSGGLLGRNCDPCAKVVKPVVPPKCGKVRTKKTLVKKTIECQVPVYKCVVVCCNSGCGACDPCGCGAAPMDDAPVLEETPENTVPAAPVPAVSSASLLRLDR